MVELNEPIARLRAELERQGVDGFVVPRADEHQGEYVPPHAARLGWLSGFTGSAGIAIVLQDKAAIFVDGRYTLQVRNEVDTDLFETRGLIDDPPDAWISENMPAGAKLGYDPWLHPADGVSRLRAACEKAGAELVACNNNPIDTVWTDQPPPPSAPVVPHPLEYCGEESASKRARIGENLADKDARAAVLTLPDSIAWLLNIRGGDVTHSPLPLCFAIAYADGRADLFLDPVKLSDGLAAHLGSAVTVSDPEDFGTALDRLGEQDGQILVDTTSAASWITDRLERAGAAILASADPCILPKARKNATEIAGTKAAHLRDGAALSNFLAWLDRAAQTGAIDELTAAAKLRNFREATGKLRDLSFPTISGAGPNGAIVHYSVSEKTNSPLEPGSLYLVDSGGQYLDGTTDVTRTVAIGTPSAEQRTRFTQVLKGHIGLSSIRFPKGVTGAHLDVLARQALWKAGLDYDHGTGHGVGSYLSVHEGPQNISRRPNNVPLEPGMIVSDEPGYYKTGEFGIRIENLILATGPDAIPGGEREMMGFEPLTFAPIDLRLVERALLSDEEAAWLNGYHAQVRERLSPHVLPETVDWLAAATMPI